VSQVGWFDLGAEFPGVRGLVVHVLPASRETELVDRLEAAGFVIATLDGGAVRDEASFFREAERALRLPAYFGHNWDALDDCLHDFGEDRERRRALVWRAADSSLAADAQLFVDALHVLSATARDLGSDDPPTQFEVFVLGESPAFGGSGQGVGQKRR